MHVVVKNYMVSKRVAAISQLVTHVLLCVEAAGYGGFIPACKVNARAYQVLH
jgi:hypothetical protein